MRVAFACFALFASAAAAAAARQDGPSGAKAKKRIPHGTGVPIRTNATAHVARSCMVGGKTAVQPLPRLTYDADRSPSLEGAFCSRDVGPYRQTCCVPRGSFNATSAAENHEKVSMSYNFNGTKCMPSLVIIGAQKAGSTALAGLMATSPHVRFSTRKEVHYFDSPQQQCAGTQAYLARFANANAKRSFVTAEATPFYLASPHAAANMLAVLPPAAAIVALLREPASRAYSEFQMEYRRILEQNKWIETARAHTADILVCFAREFTKKESLTSCLVGRNATALRKNRLWNGLHANLLKAHAKPGAPPPPPPPCVDAPNWRSRDVEDCAAVARDPARFCAVRAERGVPAARACARTCGTCADDGDVVVAADDDAADAGGAPAAAATGDRARPGAFAAFVVECFRGAGSALAFNAACVPAAPPSLAKALSTAAPRVLACAADAHGEARPAFRAALARCLDADAAVAAYLRGAAPASALAAALSAVERALFNKPSRTRRLAGAPAPAGPPPPASAPLVAMVAACFPPPTAEQRGANARGVLLKDSCLPRMEQLPPKKALFLEAARLQTCAGAMLGGRLAVAATPAKAKAFLLACVGNEPTGGLVKEYIYRSMYSTQLRANFVSNGMPLERILFLDSARLRSEPRAVLAEVHARVGIPEHDYPADLLEPNSPLLAASIKSHFANFDSSIGWELDGEAAYDAPMPDRIRVGLQAFFQIHNADLFALLKVDPYPDWSIPGSDAEAIAQFRGKGGGLTPYAEEETTQTRSDPPPGALHPYAPNDK